MSRITKILSGLCLFHHVTICIMALTLGLGLGSAWAGKPVRGGTLKWALHPEPSILVNGLTAALPTTQVGSKMHDGLISYDQDYNWLPQLAKSWKISPDGKEITFNLQKGVKWHDGVEFTSEDVAFSMNMLKECHPWGSSKFAELISVETPDPYTAVLKLKQAAPYMMRGFSVADAPMMPKHIYEGTDYRTNPNNIAPIGTGPFKFVEWVKGSHITLRRNPDYWDQPKPYLDRIIFRLIPDAAARAIAFESGEADFGGDLVVPLSDLSRILALPHLDSDNCVNKSGPSVHRIEFNLGNRYLKNIEVRRAIAHAIDKKFICDNVWYGYAKIATGPVHNSLKPFYTADVPTYEFNPKKANELLDQAGFKRGPDGIRFRLIHDYLPIGNMFQRTAEYLKQALKKVGIEVTLRGQDFPTYVRRVYTLRDFEFTNNWMTNTADPTLGVQRLYWSKNFKPGTPFSNASGYSNPEADQALEAAKIEVDPQKRAELWHAVQRLVMRDLPAIPLAAVDRIILYNKKVKNAFIHPHGNTDNFAEVYLEER